MTARRLRWIPRLVFFATLFLLVTAVGLTIGDRTTQPEELPWIVATAVGMLGFATVGFLIASRAPSNPIGWLYLAAAFTFMLGVTLSEYVIRGSTDLNELPLVPYAAWLNQSLFASGLTCIPIALLIFPDGHLPSRRWRPVLWALVAGGVLATVVSSLDPAPIHVIDEISVDNPFGIHGSLGEGFADVANVALPVLYAVGIIGAFAAVVVRFRRARGEERQQLRWLVAAVVTVSAAVALSIATGFQEGGVVNDAAWGFLLLSIAIGLPAATGVAILRYRLYDLDLVVKKTVVFTIVAVFITVVYVGALALAAVSTLGLYAGLVVFVLTFSRVRRRARTLADRFVYGKRATPFEVMSDFSERVGDTYSVDDVLPRMTELLAGSTGASETRVWVRSDSRLTPVAVTPADAGDVVPMVMEDGELPPFGDGLIPFPVAHQGELLGAITLRMPPNDPMDPAKARLVNGVASQAGLALRNVGLVRDLRESRRRIVAAQDERAKTLERNIHDGAQQQLVALAVKLRLARGFVERDPPKAQALLDELQADATDALENLRDLARGIYPPLLADKGLVAALEAQARKSAIPVEIGSEGIGRYAPEEEATVYFCCLEALNNVGKYAEASRVTIHLDEAERGTIRFRVCDDGVGFDPRDHRDGTGIQGMRDRLAALGGVIVVTAEAGRGVTVSGTLSVSPKA